MKCKECNKPHVKVNTKYNVPYTAGYSTDGKTIYIDSRLPETFIDSRKQKVNVYKYLIIHEITEKALKDELHYSYNTAHSIAMGAEMHACTMDGINYDEYYGFIEKYVSQDINVKEIHSIPPDLDISPYIEDGLVDVVNRIKELQNK